MILYIFHAFLQNGTKDQDEHVSKEVGGTANGKDKEIKENTGKEKNKGEEEEGEAREDQQEITQRQTYVLEEKKTTVHKSVVEDTQQEHQHPKEVEHAPEEESTGEGPTTTVTDGDTTTDQEKTTYNSITSRSLEVGSPASTGECDLGLQHVQFFIFYFKFYSSSSGSFCPSLPLHISPSSYKKMQVQASQTLLHKAHKPRNTTSKKGEKRGRSLRLQS